MPGAPSPTFDELLLLPKVDLFRRLGGALTADELDRLQAGEPDTLLDPASRLTLDEGKQPHPPSVLEDLEARLDGMENRLAASPGIPALVAAVSAAAREDHVAHLEMAVSPAALASSMGSLQAVFEGLRRATQVDRLDGSPSLGWLISVSASDPVPDLTKIVRLVLDEGTPSILGLAVRLSQGASKDATPVLVEARHAGMPLLLQLEPGLDAEAAYDSLKALEPTRIVFASQLLHSMGALGWIREHRPALIVCLSAESAVFTQDAGTAQPLMQMIQAGMQVSLATWVPGLTGRGLTDDYQLAAQTPGLSLEAMRGLTMAGVQASFLGKAQKRQLEREFEDAIFGFPSGA
jgi:aminodeoxyfutalosine deaminase